MLGKYIIICFLLYILYSTNENRITCLCKLLKALSAPLYIILHANYFNVYENLI